MAGMPEPEQDDPPPGGPGRMRLSRALGISVTASLLIQALNVLTGILLARELGPTGRGELAAAILWPSLLASIGSLGVTEATTVFTARRGSSTGTLTGTMLALAAMQTVVLLPLGYVVVLLVLSQHGDETVDAALIYLPFIPITLLTMMLMSVLNGLQRFREFHLLRISLNVAIAVGLVAVAVAGQLTVTAAVVVYLVTNAGVLAATALALARARRMTLSFDRSLLREVVVFGLKSHTAAVAGQLNSRLDQLLISAFLAPARLGLYVIGVTLSSLTVLLGQSVAMVALPSVAEIEDPVQRRRRATRFVSVTTVGATLLTIPLVVLTPQLIELFFGAAFLPAADVTRVLLVASIALSLNRVLQVVLQAVNRPLDAGIAEFVAVAVTIGALAVLLPWLGILGAGLASLLAYVTSTAWMLRRAKRVLGASTADFLVPSADDVARVIAPLRRASASK